MGRKGGSIYVSTDPNNNVPIGVAGQGVAIGALGRSIYGTGSGGTQGASGVANLLGVVDHVAITPATVLVAETF